MGISDEELAEGHELSSMMSMARHQLGLVRASIILFQAQSAAVLHWNSVIDSLIKAGKAYDDADDKMWTAGDLKAIGCQSAIRHLYFFQEALEAIEKFSRLAKIAKAMPDSTIAKRALHQFAISFPSLKLTRNAAAHSVENSLDPNNWMTTALNLPGFQVPAGNKVIDNTVGDTFVTTGKGGNVVQIDISTATYQLALDVYELLVAGLTLRP
jgi:hypothetical protein